MDKRLFPSGVKATSADFNGIHDDTETAIGIFAKAVASNGANTTNIIFSYDAPVLSGASSPYTVTVPAQYVAIDGVVAYMPQQTTTVTTAQFPMRIFVTLTRSNVNSTRTYLTASGTGTASFTMQKTVAASAIFVKNYSGAGDDPAAGANDVGTPFLFATYTNSSTRLDDPLGYSWTGPAASAAAHAATHLPGGSDPISVATPATGVSAGTDGFIDGYSILAARSAITEVDVNVASSFITATESGTYNDYNDQRRVTIECHTDPDSFDVVDISGIDHLSLSFEPSTTPGAGLSKKPARYDHRHDLTASPVVVVMRELVITPSTALGSYLNITMPSGVGTITGAQIYWRPTAAAGAQPNFPRVSTTPCLVNINNDLKRVGVSTTITANGVRCKLEPNGLCLLTNDDIGLAETAVGSVNWSSLLGSVGAIPTTGTLVVFITALRSTISPL